MRIIPIAKFFFHRHWRTILICTAVILASTTISLYFLTTNMQTIVDTSDGQVEVRQVTNAFNDPSSVGFNSDMTPIIVALAILLIKKNRDLLTTLSVTRYEQIIAGYVYMLFMSLALTLLGKMIIPALIYAMMSLLGIAVRGGWSISMILTGNNPHFMKDLYDSFIFMIALSSMFTLIGYIMVRWWKIVLIALGATVVAGIVIRTQYSNAKLIVYIMEHISEIIQYITDVIMPFIDRVLDNSNTLLYTIRYMGFSVLCTVISYPIMRRMPVR